MWKQSLLVLGVFLLLVGCFLVYRDRHEASRQATAIVAADNNAQDTTVAIAQLRQYANAHTFVRANFSLTAAYNRAVSAAQAAAAAASSNSQVYAAAQAACSGHTDSITQAQCNQRYLAAHLQPTTGPTVVTAPQLADYQYHVRGPIWTTDAAGAVLLGGIVALVAGIPWPRRWRKRS